MKIGICIPYRNRKDHLDILIPELSKHLEAKGIEYTFYVGHQIDDRLFNRGAMKNIAAYQAFEDGCDYIAWHDVDMIPFQEADYSYPKEFPIHIATKLSKYNYGLGYDQYFGGVVLFNKDQVDKTNGYSNEYWDWGQEDDDLFWRSYFENMTTGKVLQTEQDKTVANFDGDTSYIAIPATREISSCLHRDHTITITFKAEQQDHKVPIWLVGDKQKRFIEYPLIRKQGSWTWGLSFNNSRAITMQLIDREGRHHYNWAKRFEGMWTQATLSYNSEEKKAYFYINGELISQMNGVKQNVPFPIGSELKSHDAVKPFAIGYCPQLNTYFKGKISEVKIYNTFIDANEKLKDISSNLVLDVDFNNPSFSYNNINFSNEVVEIIENIVPYRRESKFECLPHIDEGFVNGGWAKGETTARNEKRFVTEMQQGKIDYKKDGMSNILEVVKIESVDNTLYPNTKILNCTMI